MYKQFQIKKIFSGINISLFIFLFVNFLFSIKYLSRETNYYLIISLIIISIYFLIWKKRDLIKSSVIDKYNINILLFLFFTFASFFLFKKIPVLSLNVDRWSVITSFCDSYYNNQYVYFAKSNVGNPPGPMPFYFILALPFYFIGELGWFSISGIYLFFLFLKYSKTSKINITIALILTLCSIFYLWEVVSRSTIFFNSTLILFVLYYYLNIEKLNSKNTIFLGLLIGLSVFTRNVLIIPFIIAIVYQLKSKLINLKQLIFLGVITVLVFVSTFLPFVYNHLLDFTVMNPFKIQSSALIPFKYTLLFMILAIILGYYCKSTSDIYLYSGLVLFTIIVIYFLYHICLVGFQSTFFGSVADISYFILCIPFCLFYLIKNKNHSN